MRVTIVALNHSALGPHGVADNFGIINMMSSGEPCHNVEQTTNDDQNWTNPGVPAKKGKDNQ